MGWIYGMILWNYFWDDYGIIMGWLWDEYMGWFYGIINYGMIMGLLWDY